MSAPSATSITPAAPTTSLNWARRSETMAASCPRVMLLAPAASAAAPTLAAACAVLKSSTPSATSPRPWTAVAAAASSNCPLTLARFFFSIAMLAVSACFPLVCFFLVAILMFPILC